MKKFFYGVFNLAIKCNQDQVFERANGLTFRVLLAFFPFILFLMSLVGFLELDEAAVQSGLYIIFPSEVSTLVSNFLFELNTTRSTGLLSAALFFSVYNTVNGFWAIIRSINISYEVEEHRNVFYIIMLSFLLMILFSFALIIMAVLLVFGQQVLGLIFPYGTDFGFSVLSSVLAFVLLVFVTSYIYKLANAKKIPLWQVLPGGVFTVFLWVIVSAVFGFFTQNFTQLGAIYGSIAGVFILVLWLNFVSIILLIGNEINAFLFS